MKEITKEMLELVAKEIKLVADVTINTKAKTEEIEKAIRETFKTLGSCDFVSDADDAVVFSGNAVKVFEAMGLEIPKPKKATVKPTAEAKATKKTAKKEKKFTRADAAMLSIREMCKKGATLKQIVDKTDEIYVARGGASTPDAVNVNKYALNGLVAFKVLELVDGKYRFPKAEK